jgi:hypothetical protein
MARGNKRDSPKKSPTRPTTRANPAPTTAMQQNMSESHIDYKEYDNNDSIKQRAFAE